MLSELASLIAGNIKEDGECATSIPGLHLFRQSSPTKPISDVVSPTLVIVAQGAKQVMLREEVYTYDPAHYLVVSIDLPLSVAVVRASRSIPYLGMRLDLDVGLIRAFKAAGTMKYVSKAESARGIFVSRTTPELLDAVIRLLRMLKSPQDSAVLAPLLHQEILYRLVSGPQGTQLERIARTESEAHRISKAVSWLKKNFDQPISVESIAKQANMSPSGLYHHFKALTNMSPLQFQKQLRLQEARRLMLANSMDAASEAYQVGYVSPSQFNREYSRLFGAPPLRDVDQVRNHLRSVSRP
jgi:AraC-like DNA-binding protein